MIKNSLMIYDETAQWNQYSYIWNFLHFYSKLILQCLQNRSNSIILMNENQEVKMIMSPTYRLPAPADSYTSQKPEWH